MNRTKVEADVHALRRATRLIKIQFLAFTVVDEVSQIILDIVPRIVT
jgi:hypothetical protein